MHGAGTGAGERSSMSVQIVITEKSSQAKDVRAAVGSRYGAILAAEGHLLDLCEPEEVNPAWKRWSAVLLKPDGLYATKPATGGNKAANRAGWMLTAGHLLDIVRAQQDSARRHAGFPATRGWVRAHRPRPRAERRAKVHRHRCERRREAGQLRNGPLEGGLQ